MPSFPHVPFANMRDIHATVASAFLMLKCNHTLPSCNCSPATCFHTNSACRIQAVQRVDALTSMDAPVKAAVQQSFDEADLVDWVPGTVFDVSSVKQVTDLVLQHSSQKVILMCKSRVRSLAEFATVATLPQYLAASSSEQQGSPAHLQIALLSFFDAVILMQNAVPWPL